jgi:hypothetical protein
VHAIDSQFLLHHACLAAASGTVLFISSDMLLKTAVCQHDRVRIMMTAVLAVLHVTGATALTSQWVCTASKCCASTVMHDALLLMVARRL